MMGHCAGTLQPINFAANVAVIKEMEPWFTIPTDTDLFSFG